MPDVQVIHGNCLDILPTLPDCSVDSIVTDPPYGLEFMGKDWDAPWQASSKSALFGNRATVTPGFGNQRNANCLTCGGRLRGKKRCQCEKPNWDESPTSTNNRQMVGFQQWCEQWATECLRVLKPGGHLLAFGGTRTYHRMAVAIEDAGFEIRDSLHWIYGSGFPKSLDVSKAIDKRGGYPHLAAEIGKALKESRQRRGISSGQADKMFCDGTTNWTWFEGRPKGQRAPTPETFRRIVAEWPELSYLASVVDEAEREVIGSKDSTLLAVAPGEVRDRPPVELDITAPATEQAKAWSGWGTALKPAHEPIVVARKPLVGTVAGNVLQFGTGAINIDGARVGTDDTRSLASPTALGVMNDDGWVAQPVMAGSAAGRWPANIVFTHNHDCGDVCTEGCPVGELDQQSGKTGAAAPASGPTHTGPSTRNAMVGSFNGLGDRPAVFHNDTGGASRFFTVTEWDAPFRYVAKPGKRERNAGLNHLPEKAAPKLDGGPFVSPTGNDSTKVKAQNFHPTVKPLALMRWLVRLVTPPNGTVLEPFAGSGTTLVACHLEGFNAIGIEMTDEYLPIIEARLDWARQQPAQPQQLTLEDN